MNEKKSIRERITPLISIISVVLFFAAILACMALLMALVRLVLG